VFENELAGTGKEAVSGVTTDDGRQIFCEVMQQLWTPTCDTQSGTRRGLFGRRASMGPEAAHGLFTSPFSLSLAKETEQLPPAFKENGANASVRYELEVRVKWKSIFRRSTQ
jgi:hypothetical protein